MIDDIDTQKIYNISNEIETLTDDLNVRKTNEENINNRWCWVYWLTPMQKTP